MRLVRLFPWGNFWGLVAGLWLVNTAQSGVTLDGTLGPAGALPGPDFQITADLGQQVGGNLFHSFGQFSIHTSESATFSGPNSIGNIIGRVTGGEVSFIDGALRSTIPGANLYLLNPSGVLFGEHATLDVPGSVHISTADYLRLSDGGRFDARTPANSVLTVAPVAAFGFLSETPAPITMTGSFLQVPEGQTLSLIGGDLTLSNATLYAPVGRIDVATVASAGEVIPTDSDLTLQGFDALGTFTLEHTLEERPIVDFGEPIGERQLGNLDTSGTGGGAIFIQGGQWVSRGGLVRTNTYGDQNGHGIQVAISGATLLENNTALQAATLSTGDAGRVVLDVGHLSLTDESSIRADTIGTGRSGEITINANEAVIIAGGSLLSAGSESTKAAGTIRITTPELTLENGGVIQTLTTDVGDAGSIDLNVEQLILTGGSYIIANSYGNGSGGEITINANKTVIISGLSSLGAEANEDGLDSNEAGTAGTIRITTPELTLENGFIFSPTSGVSDGGSIEINVGRLSLTGGSKIDMSTSGSGNSGEIIIEASEAVVITSTVPGNYSILSSNAEPDSTGNAGMIRITTPLLTIGEGGGINSSTYEGAIGNGGTIDLHVGRLNLTGGGSIFADTFGAGRGGEIIVHASEGVNITGAIAIFGDNIRIPIGGLSTNASNTSTKDAGTIRIIAPLLTIKEGGSINSSTSGTGNGGSIELNLGQLMLTGDSRISASSLPFLSDIDTIEVGNGGDIIVNASEGVTITGSSNLSTEATGITGNAGDITVTTPNLTIASGSGIWASSLRTTGGNIVVNADHLKLLDGSAISSSVFGDQQSDGGNVTINSTNFVALDGSSVTAQANQGRGGNILVNAQVFLHDAANVEDVLNASSQVEGNDGTVQNNAPTTDISGSLVALDTNYLDAAAQLSHRCGTNDSESRSRFIVRGRGALPASPDGTLPAPTSRCQSLTTSPPTTDEPPATAQPVAITQPLGFGNR